MKMAQGVEVVKDEINRQFHPMDMRERWDSNTKGKTLYFDAEQRHFTVHVTYEFDDDYASGQIKVDLRGLANHLRASKDGRATVSTTGIS